ncbi:unnamed protein product [Rhizophagus irregularis]|nr:unnamed protein product [Rhizophagus irregularis]
MNGGNLLQDLVNLLKPFFDATELLLKSTYTTLNFVYPTIYFLMEKFSISNKSDNELFDLIYNSEQEEENTPVKPRLSRISLKEVRGRGQGRGRGSGNKTIEKLQRLYSNEKFENELNAITTSHFGSASNVHQTTNTSSSSNSIFSALFDDDDVVEYKVAGRN